MRKTMIAAIAAAAIAVTGLSGCGDDSGKKEEKAVTLGIVQLVEHPALDAANKGIVSAIEKRGIKAAFDQQNAQADQSNLANIAQRFVNNKYPLVFAIATPAAQTMANATSTTPIVATAVTDFVAAKLVKTNEKPGTNVTGSSDMNPVGAQLDLLLQFVPGAKNIGTIYNSSEINSQVQVDILKEEAAKHEGLRILEVTISSVNDVQQAVSSLVGKIDALYLPTDNVAASCMPVFAKITNEKKIPVITGEAGMVAGGGLATYGVDYYQLGQIAGNMAADILEGKAKPQDMAIRFQEQFTATVNETTVKALGIAVPESIAKSAVFVH